jgi:hypothetical protein
LAGESSISWIEEAIEDINKPDFNHVILWWSKTPSGTQETINQLRDRLKAPGYFMFYLGKDNQALFEAKVVDFAISDKEYKLKNWNINKDVAWYYKSFKDYVDPSRNQSASIVFLCDSIEKLKHPFNYSDFKYYNGYTLPKRGNLQPIIGINSENIKNQDEFPRYATKHDPETIINHISDYIKSQGFNYHIQDIANFYLCLKTKPFVILAGISGTGKTKLVELFAKAIGYGDDDHCVIIPVKPDWTDNSDLLGYTNLNKEFEKKKLTEVILAAHKNPDDPYFVILDEMNLARVEHYFSDFLSIIETRKIENGKFSTKPLLNSADIGEKTENRIKLIDIKIPQNLYIVGTVNMDETTFPFSKKVLDRANSIEMNQVELDFINKVDPVNAMQGIYNDFLISDKINSSHINEEEFAWLKENDLIGNLIEINEILAEADLQFAYRIRDEISFYMLHSKLIQEIFPWDNALDYQIMQKILPRIQGSAISISYLLINLINYFMGDKDKFDKKSHYEDIQEDLHKYIVANPKFSRTLKKLDFMLRRYNQDGFTSFWI